MYRTNLAAIFVAILLTACGGGGSTSSTPAATQSSTSTTPDSTTSASAVVLPVLTNPMTLGGATINIAVSQGKYLIKTTGGAVSVAGDQNTVKIDATSSVGVMQVSGKQNHLIFDVKATVSSLTISGDQNIIYLPEGSPIVVANAGTMSVQNKVKYYKP